jgi:predicted Zn-dependent peptidase
MTEALLTTPYRVTKFANGLRLLTCTLPYTRSVTVSVYIGAGPRYETPAEAGISHFLEHLCFKGSEKRPTPLAVSEAIDGLGGMMNAVTDRELTVFYAKVASAHWQTAVDVLVDLVRRPVLDAEEMEKERLVVLEELAAVNDSPAQQVDLLVDELLWPGQALGRDIAGTPESVQGLTRSMALDYMADQYVPSNLVVAVAGNVRHDEVEAALETTLGDDPAGAPRPWEHAVDGRSAPRCRVLYKHTEQTHLSLAVPGLPLEHPDRYALDLLSVLFGEGMSSRVWLELRERQGLCYDVHSYISHFLDAGAFGVYAAVAPANGARATQAIVGQLAGLRAGVPEVELHKAKELTKGRMLLRLEDTRSVSAWMGGQEMLTGHVLTPEEVIARIDAVTPEDVSRVVEALLHRERMSLAVVGPHRSERRFLSLLDL